MLGACDVRANLVTLRLQAVQLIGCVLMLQARRGFVAFNSGARGGEPFQLKLALLKPALNRLPLGVEFCPRQSVELSAHPRLLGFKLGVALGLTCLAL